jgi:hypothetical protein
MIYEIVAYLRGECNEISVLRCGFAQFKAERFVYNGEKFQFVNKSCKNVGFSLKL